MFELLFESLNKHFGVEEELATTFIPAKPTFYIHFREEDLKIISASANDQVEEGNLLLEVDDELGMKFMMGEENFTKWAINNIENKYVLIPAEQVKMGRLDIGFGMFELQPAEIRGEIHIEVVDGETIHIHYDGEKVMKATQPARIYFTKEGDMSYLKLALKLDVNILNEIKQQNGLDNWPNPIVLKMKETDDLSIFTIKGQLRVTLQ